MQGVLNFGGGSCRLPLFSSHVRLPHRTPPTSPIPSIGHHGRARACLRFVPWRAGARDDGRIHSASDRQADRLSLRPVGRVPRRTTQISADAASAGISARLILGRNGGLFRRRASSIAKAYSECRKSRRSGARRNVGSAWRFAARDSGLFQLIWTGFDRAGAGNSRSTWFARDLHRRSARRLALRHSHVARARLHADRRWKFDRGGRRGRRRVACDADGPRRCLASARRSADIACLRQRTQMSGIMRKSTFMSILALELLADPRMSAAADDARGLVARGDYLARAGDCVACHTAMGGKAFVGGLAMGRPSAHSIPRTSLRTSRPASANGAPTSSTR